MLKVSAVIFLLAVLQVLVYVAKDQKIQSKHKELILNHYSYNTNLRYGNFTVSSTNETHLGALQYDMYVDIQNVFLQIILLNLDGNQIMLNHTLNCCKIAKTVDRIFLVRVLTQSFLDNLDFKVKCPFKKGLYQLKARLRPLNKESQPYKKKSANKTRFHYFPSFIKTNDTFSVNYIMLTKIQGKMVHLFNSLEGYRVDEVAD